VNTDLFRLFDRTKISGSDPLLTAVCTAYPAPPFLTIFHPPIEPAGVGPGGRLDLDGWLDFTAIRFSKLLQVVLAELYI
jgi:hypothetical protein